MSNTGFPKIANAGFTHMKPNLCPHCAHCSTVYAYGYDYVCHAKNHKLSAITTEKGRCADFEQTEERRISQSDVEQEIQQLREMKARITAYRAARS